MRTTIEMKPEHRARLLEIAALRGEKGFSSVVADAIEAYLAQDANAIKLRQRALELRGSLGRKEADQLRDATERLRKVWR